MPTHLSGRMIVMALRTDGNHRYSWTKEQAITVRKLDATAHPPLYAHPTLQPNLAQVFLANGLKDGLPWPCAAL